ncbi:MAG: glycosyltransferase family 4 protein, partial [Cyanobacteria bacterium]|nr:glycosyltransferase family 4 protein [Cyanobacteriota bacterium]
MGDARELILPPSLPLSGGIGGPLRLALVCSGLGNVNRGFEISTARWFKALQKNTDWDVKLFCGGDFPHAKTIPNINRDSNLLRPIMKLPFLAEKTRWELTYVVEQLSFMPGLLKEIQGFKPNILWTKDVPLAHLLWGSKPFLGLDFKLIFANGGALKPSNYHYFERIQQLHLTAWQEAVEFGIPEAKMDLVPNCVLTGETVGQPDLDNFRAQEGLSPDDFLIVCAAAWNKYHKRIDYLIEEVASLQDHSIKLLLLGVPEADTHELKAMGEQLLGNRVLWRTLPPDRVSSVMRQANLFILPSLIEGLGNALIEAAMAGIPIICHPHGGAKFILQDEFWMHDLVKTGALARQIREFRQKPPSEDQL